MLGHRSKLGCSHPVAVTGRLFAYGGRTERWHAVSALYSGSTPGGGVRISSRTDDLSVTGSQRCWVGNQQRCALRRSGGLSPMLLDDPPEGAGSNPGAAPLRCPCVHVT